MITITTIIKHSNVIKTKIIATLQTSVVAQFANEIKKSPMQMCGQDGCSDWKLNTLQFGDKHQI